jgi:hypothetical protein
MTNSTPVPEGYASHYDHAMGIKTVSGTPVQNLNRKRMQRDRDARADYLEFLANGGRKTGYATEKQTDRAVAIVLEDECNGIAAIRKLAIEQNKDEQWVDDVKAKSAKHIKTSINNNLTHPSLQLAVKQKELKGYHKTGMKRLNLSSALTQLRGTISTAKRLDLLEQITSTNSLEIAELKAKVAQHEAKINRLDDGITKQDQAKALKLDGHSLNFIATELNVSKSTVQRYFR